MPPPTRDQHPDPPPLRAMLLNARPETFGLTPTERLPDVWAGVFEMPIGEREAASTVAIADGSVSLYTTSGFGIIGAGGHPGPRRAADAFLAAVQWAIDELEPVPTADVAYPVPGTLAVVAMTHSGIKRRQVPHDRLKDLPAVGAALRAGNDLMTELRRINEERRPPSA